MAQEFGRLRCRVCGDQVVVPLWPSERNGDPNDHAFELTCSNGHTDTYDESKVETIQSKPAASLKMRRAVAGIG